MIKFSWPADYVGGIMVADNALDEDICRTFVNYASSVIDTVGSPGKTISGVKLEHKNSTDMVISNISIQEEHGVDVQPMLRMFEGETIRAISSCVAHYRHQIRALWQWTNIVDSGFQVQRYKSCDGYYREHYDSSPWIPEINDRVLSAIVYLNTVEIGGETEFPLHKTSVSPVIGRICLFPSNFTHPHAGNPSYSQDKWIISTFLSSSQGGSPTTFKTVDQLNTPPHEHDQFDPTDKFEWQKTGVNNGHEDHQH